MWLILCCKQKTAYERRIRDWSSDVCSSDLICTGRGGTRRGRRPDQGAACNDLSPVELHILHGGMKFTKGMWRKLGRYEKRRPEIGRASCRERVAEYV